MYSIVDFWIEATQIEENMMQRCDIDSQQFMNNVGKNVYKLPHSLDRQSVGFLFKVFKEVPATAVLNKRFVVSVSVILLPHPVVCPL